MATNILEFDEGYDAFELGEDFDTGKSESWQEGWLEAQQNEEYA